MRATPPTNEHEQREGGREDDDRELFRNIFEVMRREGLGNVGIEKIETWAILSLRSQYSK